jgi:RNA polymerase sigma factor (sigma-70 family)
MWNGVSVASMDEKRARFEAQVLPHLDAAYRFARWLAYAPGDADDIVQEAILRAFRGFDALRGSDVKSWLLTIVRNCHYTAAKQQQRRGHVPLPEEGDADQGHALVANTPDPERESMLRDEQRTLDGLLASLPEEQRTVLVLREVEEMDYAQIAAVINVPIGTVMSRLARSRAALKTRWLQQAQGEPRAVR